MEDLELKRAELDVAIRNFNAAHQAYHDQLEDQLEIHITTPHCSLLMTLEE